MNQNTIKKESYCCIRYTFHPDARKEILKRLLELNHKIHDEEVKAGFWDKKKTGAKYAVKIGNVA